MINIRPQSVPELGLSLKQRSDLFVVTTMIQPIAEVIAEDGSLPGKKAWSH